MIKVLPPNNPFHGFYGTVALKKGAEVADAAGLASFATSLRFNAKPPAGPSRTDHDST